MSNRITPNFSYINSLLAKVKNPSKERLIRLDNDVHVEDSVSVTGERERVMGKDTDVAHTHNQGCR